MRDARVQRRAHEHVVQEIARHAHLRASRDRDEIHAERDAKAPDHRDRHDVAVVVDDLGEAEEAGEVEAGCDDHRGVDRGERVAVVGEGPVAEGGDGEALLLEAGKDVGEEELEENVARVDLPGVCGRVRVL